MVFFFNGKAQFSSQCLVIFKKKKSYFLCLLISLVAWTFTPRFVCQLVRSWLILSLQHLHKAKYSLFGLKYLMKYFYFHLFILFFILPVKSFLSLPQSFSGLCFSFQRLKILEVNTFKTKVKKKTPFFPLDCFFAEDNTVYLAVAREIVIVLFLQFTSDFWNISMTINVSIFSQHILRAIVQCM